MVRHISTLWYAALILFVIVAAGMLGGPGSAMDRSIIWTMSEFRFGSPALSSIAATLTLIGGAAFTLSGTLVAALLMFLKRRRVLALILAAVVLVERALVDLLKEVTARPRPSGGEFLVESLAFPSGHAANSMTAFLAIALLAVPPAHRRPAVIAAVTLSLLVGLTRIILGVHWPSDVIGGWAIGLAAVALAIAVARRSGALEPDHQIVGRHGPALDEDEAA